MESIINYIKSDLNKAILYNNFPIRCFTCNEILSHKYELFLLIRYYLLQKEKEMLRTKLNYQISDEELDRTTSISVRNISSILIGETDIFDNCNYKTFQILKIHKCCCKRMFMSMAI